MNLLHYFAELGKSGQLPKTVGEVQSQLSTTFKSEIQKVFSFDQFNEAIEYYDSNSSKGKILLKFNWGMIIYTLGCSAPKY